MAVGSALDPRPRTIPPEVAPPTPVPLEEDLDRLPREPVWREGPQATEPTLALSARSGIIDCVRWHLHACRALGLPDDRAGTQAGMFLSWIGHRSLASREFRLLAGPTLRALHNRELTGRVVLLEALGGVLPLGVVASRARAFSTAYFASAYFRDYERVLASDLPSPYHVEDSWANYDRLEPTLDLRWRSWPRLAAVQAPVHQSQCR